MSDRRAGVLPWALNILIPGAGVILTGNVWVGALLALLFAAAANFLVWGIWIIPDNAAPWMLGIALAAAVGVYFAAQFQMAQSVRRWRELSAAARRQAALAAIVRHLDDGAATSALAEAERLRDLADDDLHVAYRRAQVLTLAQHVDAREACRRVRAIDIHHIYRAEVQRLERQLDTLGRDAAGPT